jgi:hypothetical protein
MHKKGVVRHLLTEDIAGGGGGDSSNPTPANTMVSLKFSEVTRLPRPILSPMKRSTSGSLSLKWSDYPTQLNLNETSSAPISDGDGFGV